MLCIYYTNYELPYFTGEQCPTNVSLLLQGGIRWWLHHLRSVYTLLTQVVANHSRFGVYTYNLLWCGWTVGGHPDRREWIALSTSIATGLEILMHGISDPQGESWLGLKNIHCLTLRSECMHPASSVPYCMILSEWRSLLLIYSFSVGNPGIY